MKKLFICCLMALFATAAFAEKQTVVLYIPGMECSNCQGKVDKILAFEKGVRSLDYNLAERRVTVVYDDRRTDVARLQAALMKHLNYKSYEIDSDGNMKMPAAAPSDAQSSEPHTH